MNRMLIEMMLSNLGGPVTSEDTAEIIETWTGIDRLYIALTATAELRERMLAGEKIEFAAFMEQQYGFNEFEMRSLAQIMKTTDLLDMMGMDALSKLVVFLVGIEIGKQDENDPERVAAALAANNHDREEDFDEQERYQDPDIPQPQDRDDDGSLTEPFSAPLGTPVAQPNQKPL